MDAKKAAELTATAQKTRDEEARKRCQEAAERAAEKRRLDLERCRTHTIPQIEAEIAKSAGIGFNSIMHIMHAYESYEVTHAICAHFEGLGFKVEETHIPPQHCGSDGYTRDAYSYLTISW